MFRTPKSLLPVMLLAGSLLLPACSPGAQKTPTVSADEILTQAAGTVAVELTRVSALTPSPLPATATSEPTNPPLPNPDAATATIAAPTTAPAATNTPIPASPTESKTQDAASFVADVTVPDGTGAAPGIQFEKVWRIKNTGVTNWTEAYALVWVDGEKMGAPDSIPIPKEVRPGETVDISVNLTAPSKPGTYQTFFRLRNASGQFFRLDGTGDLWIKITVGGSSPTPDLTATAEAPTPTPSATQSN